MKNKRWCHLSSGTSGFTLIELLVVVVIIGIISSIAAPGWLSFLNRQKINTVRTELRNVLQDAQSKAQQKSTAYGVVFGSTANGPTAALSTAGSIAPVSVLGSGTKNIQMAAFAASTTSVTSLEFDYRGSVSDDDIPFVVKITADNNSSAQKCLIITSLLGNIVDADGATCDNPNLGI